MYILFFFFFKFTYRVIYLKGDRLIILIKSLELVLGETKNMTIPHWKNITLKLCL